MGGASGSSANELDYWPEFGFSVDYIVFDDDTVCVVAVWAGMWRQCFSGTIDGEKFILCCEQPPAYWDDTLKKSISAAEASTESCN